MKPCVSNSNRLQGPILKGIALLNCLLVFVTLAPISSFPDVELARPSGLAAHSDTRNSATPATLEEKIQVLSDTASRPGARYDPVVLTDDEANAYLRDHAREFLPPAVQNLALHIASDHVTGTAEVDFNQLNQGAQAADDWTSSIVTSLFKGKQRVTADGKLDTSNGQGKVGIENVAIGSTSIPDWLVQILLENYVQKRYNVDLSKPFALPDHVTKIELAHGRATFIRSPKKGL